MSTHPAADRGPTRSLEMDRDELLRRGRPLPPYDDMVIDELTDEEAEAFWAAINEA